MKSKMSIIASLLVVGLSGAPLEAQHPVEGMEWMVQNLRERGQPVIPIFEGWYPRDDGTFQLCFGYFNLNTEEAVRIPVGPENFIDPPEFDGNQSTYFLPVPRPPNTYRRYFCTFSVNVPPDIGTERVWWTLVQDEREYRVPGHITNASYRLEERYQRSRESYAPIVRFVEPEGPQDQGRDGMTAGPVTAEVGASVPLVVEVTHPEGTPAYWWVKWALHSGPGDVNFVRDEIELEGGETMARTSANFSEPGAYVLRVQAIDEPGEGGSYQFQCCWTNGFVEVVVQ